MVRTNPGTDPVLSVWGWEIPVYLFLGGLTAGLMVVGALLELVRLDRYDRRASVWGALLGIGALSAGMAALLMDLEHKLYVPRFYLAFRPSSPMSWGAWILVVAYPALALWLTGSVDRATWEGWEKRFAAARLLSGVRRLALERRRGLLVFALAVGAGLGVYTGILLQTLAARPLWSTGLLGPLFLASGVSAGAAAYMLIGAHAGQFRDIVAVDLAALAAELVLLLLFFVEKGSGTLVDRAAAMLVLAGPYTGAFFGLVVLAGILAPLLIESRELGRPIQRALAAPLLVLSGGFALRAVLVAAGQVSSYSMLGG